MKVGFLDCVSIDKAYSANTSTDQVSRRRTAQTADANNQHGGVFQTKLACWMTGEINGWLLVTMTKEQHVLYLEDLSQA